MTIVELKIAVFKVLSIAYSFGKVGFFEPVMLTFGVTGFCCMLWTVDVLECDVVWFAGLLIYFAFALLAFLAANGLWVSKPVV